MISILWTILKLLGIFLLVLLCILLLLLLLVLFVPIRYMAFLQREADSGQAFSLKLKATWLLHFLNIRFSYPEEAYVRVRVLCFTIFRSDKEKKDPVKEKPAKDVSVERESERETAKESQAETDPLAAEEASPDEAATDQEVLQPEENDDAEWDFDQEEKPSSRKFFKKLFSLLKNLRYTIAQICDKIKKIVKNIKYYIEIINSGEFKKSFQLCSRQAAILFRHICPQKIKGRLLIGTGDPASTGQVLAVYGMLYPFLGNKITITADFEQRILEGELSVKGRITLFRLVRCAWIIYFNKDLRRVIKMLKREAK